MELEARELSEISSALVRCKSKGLGSFSDRISELCALVNSS